MRKLLIAIAVIAAGYGVLRLSSNNPMGGHGMMGGAMPVGVAAAIEKDVVLWDEFSGRVTAMDRVEVRPRVPGTIEAIRFTDGQMVKKGDALITIDPRPYQAALQEAGARAAFAEGEFARAKALLPEKAISQREYDDKRSAAEAARAALTKARLDLSYTNIEAPIDGRISRAEITVGNLVAAGGGAPLITTIVSLDPIYVDFDIDEQSYVKYLAAHGGDPQNLAVVPVSIGLAGDSGFPYEGSIESFDNELNTRAGTVRVRARFDNKAGTLIPGLFAHVRIGGSGAQKALLVNDQAVGTDQDKKFVLVVDKDNKAQYRAVTLGPVTGGLRVIKSGLAAGERVVASGIQRAHPGAEVMPQPVDMETLKPLEQASGAGIQDSGEKKDSPETAEQKPEGAE